MWIMMEYCDLGDLNQFFRNYKELLEDIKRRIELIRQIAKGIAFLHDSDIAHRDIKPDNVMVKSLPNNKIVIKLGDFGLSRIFHIGHQTSEMNTHLGTPKFQAPEFWAVPTRYHRSADIYAAGLSFTAMMQAVGDGKLIPKAEGSLYLSESKQCIGQTAYLRQLNNRTLMLLKMQPMIQN